MLMAFAGQMSAARDVPLLSLAPDHFRDTATVQDDPIAGVTKVSTEKGYVEHHGPLGTVWNDEYLSGIIDRKTGSRSFEVIVTLTYRGARRAYVGAKFQGESGPRVANATLLKTNSINCPTGECTYTDRISFPLEESLLRALAARGAAGSGAPQLWHYTLAAKPGGDYSGALSSAEIGGFLAKIDEYTGAAPPPAAPSAAAAKPDLGVGGLHVGPSAQGPTRSGVLVTAVASGSIAEKAGIIVGDIVHEIDGHAIDTPADMQAAIAAAAPHAAVVIKAYRGMTEMKFNAQL